MPDGGICREGVQGVGQGDVGGVPVYNQQTDGVFEMIFITKKELERTIDEIVSKKMYERMKDMNELADDVNRNVNAIFRDTEYLREERFIDEVVERINRKQIRGGK